MLNTKIDLEINAVSYLLLSSYGKMYIGNNGIEYYNNKNVNDFILIPYDQIEYISAQVLFNRYITRFVIICKNNMKLSFSTRNNKKTLQSIKKYIDGNKLVKSPSFFTVLKNGIKKIIGK